MSTGKQERMCKKALITGITGQDGGYLAALLLSQGYIVHGAQRPASTDVGRHWRLEALNIMDGSCITPIRNIP